MDRRIWFLQGCCLFGFRPRDWLWELGIRPEPKYFVAIIPDDYMTYIVLPQER